MIGSYNDVFLRACNGERTERVPVWFMRQAGRALPEYRKVRERFSLLEICRRPEVAAEVTLQPIRRLRVDAAILFSDIMVPLQAMGVALEIEAGRGPVIEDPVRTPADVERLRPLEPETDLPHVLETIRILRGELTVPLIGFAGAPYTLASYLIEGGASRDHARTKLLMHSERALWTDLMAKLTDAVIVYLHAQVAAGAQAIQLFDSWIGHLAPDEYEAFVLPSTRRIFASLATSHVPKIHFGVGAGELLTPIASTSADVIGVDWRLPLDRARTRTGAHKVLQGNLDPVRVLAPWSVLHASVLDVLERGGGHRHVFNLGHGVLPKTDPDSLVRVVETVASWTADG